MRKGPQPGPAVLGEYKTPAYRRAQAEMDLDKYLETRVPPDTMTILSVLGKMTRRAEQLATLVHSGSLEDRAFAEFFLLFFGGVGTDLCSNLRDHALREFGPDLREYEEKMKVKHG